MPPLPPPRPRAALTLVEVLVALTLLGMGVLGTLSVQATTIALATQSHRHRTVAVHLTSVLDSLRAIPCGSVASGADARPFGLIAWRVTRAPAALTIAATATPSGGRAFRAETVVPCP